MSDNNLKIEEAIKRKEQISDVHYNLNIVIDKASKTYNGETLIKFNFRGKNDDELQIDFITKNINSIKLNNQEITNYKTDDFLITIPTRILKNSSNTITLNYTNEYNKTGSGFHRFIDPEDSEIYIHTDFEPFDAHRLFPCFDQPDLKATYKLSVKGPKDWQYIHNTDSISESINGELKTTNFNKTALFSTYIFALVIGPHKVWNDQYNNIPLKIYCRKSLAKYIDADNLFNITKESFHFLEEYFRIPYPYKKYDQIFVPEFNFGAMENVGCVTFAESYIFKTKKLYSEYLNRSNTFFHEMVHMWFGNLVTMKWWNDLWLNESFADYLSYYAMSKGNLFPDALEYLLSRKEWAYMQDQLSTTHPIVGSAHDTNDAFSNFDGISYSKGASVLKQLTYFIGEDKFRNGIRIYLKKYYEKNTVLDDFLSCMSETSGINIIEWSKKWLETTGVNTLKLEGNGDENFIIQMPSDSNNILREHAIMYEAYIRNNNKVILSETNKVLIKNKKTEITLKETADFILLNANDYDYAKIYFGDQDLNFIYEHIHSIDNRFTRKIIWCNLWQMLRDNSLSPIWFLELVEKQSDLELNKTVLESHMLQKVNTIKNIYLTEKNRNSWSNRLYKLSIKNLNKAKDEQTQISWFNLLLSCSESEQTNSFIYKILNKDIIFQKIAIDQDKRWRIITTLASNNFSKSTKLIEIEEKLDPSDIGKKSAFKAKISLPDLNSKLKYWKMFTSNIQEHSSSYLRHGMQGFFWNSQRDLLKEFSDKFFNDLENIHKTKDVHYASDYSTLLFPSIMDINTTAKKTVSFIRDNNKLTKLSRKYLIENNDNLNRRLPIILKQR